MDRMESDPIIHDCEAFERWLRDQQREESTIRNYVSCLKRLSRELEIEIGPATIGGRDAAVNLADRLAEKNVGENLSHGYLVAANRYADFVQASKYAQKDDETRIQKPEYPSTKERYRIVLDLLRQMEMPVSKGQVGKAFADHLDFTDEQRTEMAKNGQIPLVDQRVGWVLSALKHAGFIRQPRNKIWTLTEDGRRLPFEDFWQRKREREQRQERERGQRRQRSKADSPANNDMSEADEEIEAEADWQEVPEPYDVDSTLRDLFVGQDQLARILDSIKRRKNLILQGPPGVGKTFIARRIAWCLIGSKDPNPVERVHRNTAGERSPCLGVRVSRRHPVLHADADLPDG